MDSKRVSSAHLSRRRFLRFLYGIAGTVLGGGAIFNIYRAVKQMVVRTPSSLKPRYVRFSSIKVAMMSSFLAVGDYRIFPFINRSGVVIRVPQPINGGLTVKGKHFIAYDQKCTHQGCTVAYHKTQASSAANPLPSGPLLVCPCHGSVFSAYEAGESVAGPARKPLARIELAENNGALNAIAIELN